MQGEGIPGGSAGRGLPARVASQARLEGLEIGDQIVELGRGQLRGLAVLVGAPAGRIEAVAEGCRAAAVQEGGARRDIEERRNLEVLAGADVAVLVVGKVG